MPLDLIDLGRLAYAPALEVQREKNRAVSLGEAQSALILVEHDPVITVSHRKGVRDHLLASDERLAELGIDVQDTDRGGDITYHGPGQLVAYPIFRLNDYGLNLGRYMRLLEEVVIATLAAFGVAGMAEQGATGVWVERELGVGGGELGERHRPVLGGEDFSNPQPPNPKSRTAKLCAMGVRVCKNTTMHGLAINVKTDLSHFETIDPCGLGHRPVTSLRELLGGSCPTMAAVKVTLAEQLETALERSIVSEANR